MVLDGYIKQYLSENRYSNEEIESESFNIDSLRDDFSIPIDLSKVSNFDDLKMFPVR